MVTPYAADRAGIFRPERPSSCCWAPQGVTCRLVVSHRRTRKTGPCHPLLVMRCLDHKRAFTLYPCGHVPYGRHRVAPVSEDGALLNSPAWSATMFHAPLDAGAGVLWPAHSPADDPHRRRTQSRYIERAALLLGLSDVAPLIAQGLTSTHLAGDTLAVLEAATALDSAVGVHARGLIVADLIKTVPLRPGVLDAVLLAGSVAGLWGPPIRWEPARGRRRFLLSPPRSPP